MLKSANVSTYAILVSVSQYTFTLQFFPKYFSHKGHIYGKCGHCLAGNYMGQVDPKMLIFVVGSLRLILVFSQKALFWIPVMRSGSVFMSKYWGTLIVELKVGGLTDYLCYCH
jgi:hypothetical protein